MGDNLKCGRFTTSRTIHMPLTPFQTNIMVVKINFIVMRLQEPLESNVLTMYNSSTYVEDAVWTLAHAVNNCISSTDSVGMCSRNISRYIEDFSTDKACQSNLCKLIVDTQIYSMK